MLEAFIWLTVAIFYIANRTRAAVRQIRLENAVRRAVERAKQKQKIDLLYGRNNDD